MGKFAQAVANALIDEEQPRLVPGLVAFQQAAMDRLTIGGSIVECAANIQLIARARAFASAGSSPG
jgi:hypothetical protein